MSNSHKQEGLVLLAELDKIQNGDHVMMAKSTEHYVRRQPISRKRKLRYYLYLIFYLIYSIRCAIISLYDEQWIIWMADDLIEVLGNKK